LSTGWRKRPRESRQIQRTPCAKSREATLSEAPLAGNVQRLDDGDLPPPGKKLAAMVKAKSSRQTRASPRGGESRSSDENPWPQGVRVRVPPVAPARIRSRRSAWACLSIHPIYSWLRFVNTTPIASCDA